MIAAIVAFWYIRRSSGKERLNRAWGRLAEDLRLGRHTIELCCPPERYTCLDLFSYEYMGQITDSIQGCVDDHPVRILNYHTRNGGLYGAVLFELPLAAPRLMLRPERHGITAELCSAGNQVTFESMEFNRRCRVNSVDEKFAFDVLHPRMIEVILTCRELPVMELSGPYLLLYYGPFSEENQTHVKRLRALLALGREMVRQLPAFVLHEHAPCPPAPAQ